MKHRTILFTLLLCLCCAQLSAQEWNDHTSASNIADIAEEGEHLWLATKTGLVKLHKSTLATEMYTRVNSGLPSVFLTAIAVDSKGVKWIGTEYGLALLDGNNWTVLDSLTSPFGREFIIDIALDRSNNVWVATYNKVAVYKTDATWTVYDATQQEGLDNISCLYPDASGSVWAGKFCWDSYHHQQCKGAYQFINSTWVPALQQIMERRVSGITSDRSGTVWFATNLYEYTLQTTTLSIRSMQGTVIACNGADTQIFTKEMMNYRKGVHSTSNYVPGALLTTIAVDSAGGIWVGDLTGQGARRYDGTTWAVFDHTNSPLHAKVEIQCIRTDSEGNVWIGTAKDGLMRYDGSSWEHFAYVGGDISYTTQFASVSALAVDRNQHIWAGYRDIFGNTGPNALQFTGRDWHEYGTTTGSLCLVVDHDNVKWSLGRDWKIYQLKDDQWEPVHYDKRAYTLYVDRSNDLWIGTDGGAAKYTGSGWTEYTMENSGILATTSSITQSPDGAMWFATRKGLSKFNGTTWTSYPRTSGELPNDPHALSIVCDSAGAIWFGIRFFEGGGLDRFDGTTWHSFNKIDSQWINGVHAIVVDKKGKVWIATGVRHPESDFRGNGALFSFDGTTWKRYNTVNSPLSSNNLSSLAVDSSNHLWIGMGTGIMVYREGGVVVSVPERFPGVFSAPLLQSYPNPASSLTTISYTVPAGAAQHVSLKLYNALGTELATLVSRVQTPGEYSVEFDAGTLSDGAYYYQLQTGNTTTSRQMVVVR